MKSPLLPGITVSITSKCSANLCYELEITETNLILRIHNRCYEQRIWLRRSSNELLSTSSLVQGRGLFISNGCGYVAIFMATLLASRLHDFNTTWYRNIPNINPGLIYVHKPSLVGFHSGRNYILFLGGGGYFAADTQRIYSIIWVSIRQKLVGNINIIHKNRIFSHRKSLDPVWNISGIVMFSLHLMTIGIYSYF